MVPQTGSQLAAICCHQDIRVAQGMLQVSFGLAAAHPSAAEDHSCWDKGWSPTSGF